MKRAGIALLALSLLGGVFAHAAGTPVALEARAPEGGTPGELEALLDDDLGTGPDGAIPTVLLEALVELSPDHLGSTAALYERYGFLFVRGRTLPVGITERRILGVRLRAYNCLACHAGAEDGALVVGAPNRTLDLTGFYTRVFGATRKLVQGELEPRSLARLVGAARRYRAREGERLGPAEAAALMAYAELITRAAPPSPGRTQPYGPGRTIVAGAYRVIRFHMTPGPFAPVKPPDLFGVTARSGLLWTGNERYAPDVPPEERIARNGLLVPWVQVSPLTGRPAPDQEIVERLDRHRKMAALLVRSAPPPAPAPSRRDRHERGRTLFVENCARCHGEYTQTESAGKITTRVHDYKETLVPVETVGTDPAYEASQDMAFARRVADTPIGALYLRIAPEGTYVARPLLGLRLRFPYLHNGSVPNLRALLLTPDERPAQFQVGANAPLDPDAVGYGEGAATGARAETRDTTVPGNRATGHPFGTTLPPDAKRALIEYLKTL